MMVRWFGIAAVLLAAAPPPSAGREFARAGHVPAPVEPPPMLCDAAPAFAAWARPDSLVAASRTDDGPVPRMTAGQAAALTLAPRRMMRPVVAPGREGGPLSYAGLVRLAVPRAGTYRFALSGPAWLDVVEGGRPVASVAHGHGEPCGPIRKLVDLPLSAGDHVVQLAAAPTPNVEIMAIRVMP